MRSIWLSLVWLGAVWAAALWQNETDSAVWGMFGCAVFLALYFILPLGQRPMASFSMLVGLLIVAAATFYSASVAAASGKAESLAFLALLVFSYLTGEAVHRLPARLAFLFGAGAAVAAIGLMLANDVAIELLLYVLLYSAALAVGLFNYHRERSAHFDYRLRYEALLSEYRNLKRNVNLNEEAARAAERTNVARQIHDSVGHKLTALLMQMEVFRMNSSGEARRAVENLKSLAKESLEETRRAVKALQEPEQGGIPALLRLIRNLEAESFMQIEFTFRHGAISVELNNEQSIVVYRAVQEALTNAMRHGDSRRASVRLECPGEAVFRFEVANETDRTKEKFREGFGLKTMRERIEKVGGTLNVSHTGGHFVVKGQFPLHRNQAADIGRSDTPNVRASIATSQNDTPNVQTGIATSQNDTPNVRAGNVTSGTDTNTVQDRIAANRNNTSTDRSTMLAPNANDEEGKR